MSTTASEAEQAEYEATHDYPVEVGCESCSLYWTATARDGEFVIDGDCPSCGQEGERV